MSSIDKFKERIFDLAPQDFNDTALEIFEYQSQTNPLYKSYLQKLSIKPFSIQRIEDIPFLPIEFFKSHEIKSGNWETDKVFLSSGTGTKGRSAHHIRDLNFYKQVSQQIFSFHFGEMSKNQLIALLPSYLEQGDSSLIYMVDNLMQIGDKNSGYVKVHQFSSKMTQSSAKIILIGVTYALLDLANELNEPLNIPILIETGGMKGRKKEITRSELHENLSLLSSNIYTEYGMTELLSQAYGQNGILEWPTWSKSLIRDLNDPFAIHSIGSGALNIIDLANVDSCCFIETKDLGKVHQNGQFEVLGRMDNADIRGCSLLI